VSLKKRLRTVLVCLLLESGALLGAPMRMEELEDLLRSLSQPKVAATNPAEAKPSDL
jgi:hypothetical protein